MVERETIRVLSGEPRKETFGLLSDGVVDIAVKTNAKGVCVIEFSDKLPEDLIRILESLDLAVHSITGRESNISYMQEISLERMLSALSMAGER